MCGQQHLFSTHEEMFLWNCRSQFWDRKCLYSTRRGTRTPKHRKGFYHYKGWEWIRAISPHTLSDMWLLIHAVNKRGPCQVASASRFFISPPSESERLTYWSLGEATVIFIRPFEKRTYYAMAMSVRLSVRPSVRPSEFSGLFFNMLWDINLKLIICI